MSQLDNFITSTNYKRHGKIAFGRTNDIFFNVRYINYNTFAQIMIFVTRPEGINLGQIDLFTKENRKKYKASNAMMHGDMITITLSSTTVVKSMVVQAFLQDISAFLKENGYSSTCAICPTNEQLGYTFADDVIKEICPACHEKLGRIVSDIKQERETTGSYGKGLVGAVIGGIIGIIPWVLIGLLGYIAGVSGFIMAILSYKGYLMIKGKKGKGMVWIIAIVLIVFTYLGVQTTMGIQLYQELAASGYTAADIDFGQFFQIVLLAPFNPEYFDTGAVWTNLVLGWFFAALGSFSYLRKIKKESSGKDLEIQRLSQDI